MFLWCTLIISIILSLLATYYAVFQLEKRIENKKIFKKTEMYILLYAITAILTGLISFKVVKDTYSIFSVLKLIVTYLMLHMATIYDIKIKKIPNFIPFALVAFRVLIFAIEVFWVENALAFGISSVLGCFMSVALLYIAAKISKGGIGYGDVKLFGAIGLNIGFYPVFTIMLIALFVCLIYALPMLITKKKTMGGTLPFAPFIYTGYLITLFLALY